MNQQPKESKAYDFKFVINDQYTYYSLDDFKSPQSKELFKRYQQMEKDYKTLVDKLENMRKEYSTANNTDKSKMAPGILDLEKRVLTMSTQLDALQIDVRNEEIKLINR